MPRFLETFTTCAGPTVAKPHTELGGLVGFIISAWYFSGVLTILGAIGFLAGLVWAAGPLGMCVAAIFIIDALAEVKHWYYNERLLCIRDPECAIGTVISKPEAAFDGDRKLNLLLAPFTQLEIRIVLMDHIDRNRIMLSDAANFTDNFHGGVPPVVPTLAVMGGDPDELIKYIKALSGTDPDDSGNQSEMYRQLVIGVVDTLMLNSNVNANGEPKNFFERFNRKLANIITDVPTFNAIPVDFDPAVNWQLAGARSTTSLNPMFRFANDHTVPYLHCEIEGNYIEILLDDLITALTGFTIGCFILGPLGGLIVGFLAWLFKKIFDWVTGNDGDAAEPDIDWDDPDFTGYPGITETTGDLAVAFGPWIMDTEHHNYFEIHPVRAFYIISTDSTDPANVGLVDTNLEQIGLGNNLDPTIINNDLATRICKIVTEAEREDPKGTVPIVERQALSFGMRTRYAGGGALK